MGFKEEIGREGGRERLGEQVSVRARDRERERLGSDSTQKKPHCLLS